MLVSIIIGAAEGYAEVNWRFEIGGMYQRLWDFENFHEGDEELKHKSGGNFGAGLYLQIPFGRTKSFFIETGFAALAKPMLEVVDGYEFSEREYISNPMLRNYVSQTDLVTVLEIPVKFGYRYRLNEKSSLEASVGVYGSHHMEYGESPFAVGLTASVAYRYRIMSYGVSWQNPLFYNGVRDMYKNTFQVNIGINFSLGGMRNWDWETIGNVAGAMSNTLQETNNQINAMRANTSSQSDYSQGYSSGSKSSGSASGSGNSGKGFSASEQTSYNTDKRTYEMYDRQLASHFAGNQTMSESARKSMQQKMKGLRERWEKRGKSFPHSVNEDRKY